MSSRLGTVLAGLFGVVIGLALSVGSAHAGNRPAELGHTLMRTGEVSRALNAVVADGGGLTMMTLDAGIGGNLVATRAGYERHLDSHGHFCPWTDGGCSDVLGSQAYGRPFSASTPATPAPYQFTTEASSVATKQVCFTPASGDATGICALFRMR